MSNETKLLHAYTCNWMNTCTCFEWLNLWLLLAELYNLLSFFYIKIQIYILNLISLKLLSVTYHFIHMKKFWISATTCFHEQYNRFTTITIYYISTQSFQSYPRDNDKAKSSFVSICPTHTVTVSHESYTVTQRHTTTTWTSTAIHVTILISTIYTYQYWTNETKSFR